jgi:hypothetical protein
LYSTSSTTSSRAEPPNPVTSARTSRRTSGAYQSVC